jgi:PAS domain S-box-containing protein
MGPVARLGLTASAIAAGYFACAMLSMTLRFVPDGWAIVWPARAFLIAVLMLLPLRKWWLVAAVAPVHFLVSIGFLPEAPLLAVTVQLLGHLTVALASVLAIKRLVPSGRPFDTAASLFAFIAVVGIAVPAAINFAIVGLHVATGWFADLWQSWWQWMTAGFFFTITIPPLLVLLAQGGFSGRPRASVGLRLEMAGVAAALFATSLVAFGGLVDVEDWPAAYLAPLPLLLWAAVRFGVGGTALALLTVAAGIVVQAIQLQGPFISRPAADEIASLHLFLAATSAPLMLLAALMDERRRAATLLRQSEERLQFAAGATDTALWQWEPDPPRLWLTDNCRELFGLSGETASTPLAFLDAVHPEDQAVVGEVLRKALADGEPQPALEFRLRLGGRTRWFVLQMRAECDEVRKPAIVSGVFRDVTDRAEARREVAQLQVLLALLRDDEHRRIAEELHDSTAQHLVAAKLNMLHLRQLLPEETHALIDEARHSLQEATAEIRTFTYLLHPSQADEESLATMLHRYVPGFERRTGIATSVRIDERADAISAEMRHALLRITQESLGNVQRHARATRASVDVRCFGGNVHLIVRDNGKGIAAQAGAQLSERLRLGHGIPAMTARVRRLGGSIDVATRASGTTVHVSIPLGRLREDACPALPGNGQEERRDQAQVR